MGHHAGGIVRPRVHCDMMQTEQAQEASMTQHQVKIKHALDTVDPVWSRIRREGEDIVRNEPELASFIYTSVLHHESLEAAVVHRLAERLDHADVSGELIRQAYASALDDDPALGQAFRADIVATIDR